MEDLTYDSFFKGRLKVMQQQKGYRFSIDAVLLAHHAGLYPGKTVLDLGTGCGIIPMILGFRNPDLSIFGIEIQEELADIATANVKANNMKDRIRILHQDMKTLKHKDVSGPVDMVVSNPPYRKLNSGRMNPDSQRAVARHEIKACLADVVQTAEKLLDISGIFVTIYPVERLAELLSLMHDKNLEPKYLRMVYSGWDTQAKLILAQGAKRGKPGLKIGPPLVIYESDGSYTEEVKTMFE